MGREKVLVIATWGYPPSWYRYSYTVSIDHPVFGDIESKACSSCSSTLAIVSHLLNKFDVDVLIFGADTVVNPGDVDDVRRGARDLYSKWLETLVRSCDCCENMSMDSVEIEVLPGIGRYYGWRFAARVDHVYNQAFYKIFTKLQNRGYKWVFVDLTHGINYQLITVLYATIANSIIFGLEEGNRLIMFNSEPATGGSSRCIVGQQPERYSGDLNILDVHRLQMVIKLVRGIAQLKSLSTALLSEALKELAKSHADLYTLLNEKVVPFFNLLANGIVGLTFIGSYIHHKDGETPISTALCREWSGLSVGEPLVYLPEKKAGERVVEYGDANIYASLVLALNTIIDDVCRAVDHRYLGEYLDKLANHYEKLKLLNLSLIARETRDDISKLVEFVKRNLDVLSRCSLVKMLDSRTAEVPGKLFRAIGKKPREHLKSISAAGCSEIIEKLEYENVAKEYDKEREKVLSRDVDRALRNMCAHAGLEYISIEKLVVDLEANDIERIVYDPEVLNKVVRGRSEFKHMKLSNM